jgi:hypothetical protein
VKKNLKSLAILAIVLGIFITSTTAQEKFAEVALIPDNIDSRDSWILLISSWNIPTADEVGFPAYPNAFITRVERGSHSTTEKKEDYSFPLVELHTTDDIDKVLSYYKEKLPGFSFTEHYGGLVYTFHFGTEEFNPMSEPKIAKKIEHIQIGKSKHKLMPNAKTSIYFIFNPDK